MSRADLSRADLSRADLSAVDAVLIKYNESEYQVPVDPMDDLQCESCQ
jgi:uncharacterized protein YjbI with pentapeptide repeats